MDNPEYNQWTIRNTMHHCLPESFQIEIISDQHNPFKMSCFFILKARDLLPIADAATQNRYLRDRIISGIIISHTPTAAAQMPL